MYIIYKKKSSLVSRKLRQLWLWFFSEWLWIRLFGVSIRFSSACNWFCYLISLINNYLSSFVDFSNLRGFGWINWSNNNNDKFYLLSSISTPRATISDVLFCRRSNFCLAWHFWSWAAQSTCTFDLHVLQRSPWRVWPYFVWIKEIYTFICL